MARNTIEELSAVLRNIKRRREEMAAVVIANKVVLATMIGQYQVLVVQLQNDVTEIHHTLLQPSAGLNSVTIGSAKRNAEQCIASLKQVIRNGEQIIANLATAGAKLERTILNLQNA